MGQTNILRAEGKVNVTIWNNHSKSFDEFC